MMAAGELVFVFLDLYADKICCHINHFVLVIFHYIVSEIEGKNLCTSPVYFLLTALKKAYFVLVIFSLMLWHLVCSHWVSQILSLPPVIILWKQEKPGWNKEEFLTAWNIIMICWHSSFSSSKSHPFFFKSFIPTQVFPLFSLSLSFAVYVMVFFPLIINLLFTFFFSLGFSSCSLQICSPCSQVGDDLRCGSVGTSPTSCVRGSKDLQGSLWLPCITSVAEVGRKSCWVHPTASVSFPYTSFLFPASRSKHSCPWSRKGCVGRGKNYFSPQFDFLLSCLGS